MAADLSPDVVAVLEQRWAATPKGWRDTFNGGQYPPLPNFSVNGRSFTPAIEPGQQPEASPYTTVTGWVETVGHYEYDQFNRSGQFVLHFSGDPSIGQFLSAAAIVAGGYAFGTAMQAAGFGAGSAAGTFVETSAAPVAFDAVGPSAAAGVPAATSGFSVGGAASVAKAIGAVASVIGGTAAARAGQTVPGVQPMSLTDKPLNSSPGQTFNPLLIVLGLAALVLT